MSDEANSDEANSDEEANSEEANSEEERIATHEKSPIERIYIGDIDISPALLNFKDLVRKCNCHTWRCIISIPTVFHRAMDFVYNELLKDSDLTVDAEDFISVRKDVVQFLIRHIFKEKPKYNDFYEKYCFKGWEFCNGKKRQEPNVDHSKKINKFLKMTVKKSNKHHYVPVEILYSMYVSWWNFNYRHITKKVATQRKKFIFYTSELLEDKPALTNEAVAWIGWTFNDKVRKPIPMDE
jgi:hypothetical protein